MTGSSEPGVAGEPPVGPEELVEALRSLLLDEGVPGEEVTAAERRGALLLLGIERLALSAPPVHRFADVVARVGADPATARRFWRSLGLPDVGDDEVAFSDADVEALAALQAMLDAGVADPELSLQMTRVVGSAMSRIADAQINALGELGERHGPPAGSPSLPVGAAAFLPTLENLLVYSWRRHLQAAARRELLAGRSEGDEVERAVGFADLVGFTALAGQLSDQELAAVVERFSELAFETIAGAGGRIVKTIGDEVMFVAEGAAAAVEVALELAEVYRDDEVVSDVRVGLSLGPVVAVEGDYYGPTVNLASRAVGAAPPGGVLAGPRVRQALEDAEDLEWRPVPKVPLKGFGEVELWQVWRSGEEPPPVQHGLAALVARIPKGPIGRALWERLERRP